MRFCVYPAMHVKQCDVCKSSTITLSDLQARLCHAALSRGDVNAHVSHLLHKLKNSMWTGHRPRTLVFQSHLLETSNWSSKSAIGRLKLMTQKEHCCYSSGCVKTTYPTRGSRLPPGTGRYPPPACIDSVAGHEGPQCLREG